VIARSDVFPLDGGCDCGLVRYRMRTAPLFVHCCHCRWCQRETGASFALNALIEADRVVHLNADPEIVGTPSNSGKGQQIARCPKCCIALWSSYAGATRGAMRSGLSRDHEKKTGVEASSSRRAAPGVASSASVLSRDARCVCGAAASHVALAQTNASGAMPLLVGAASFSRSTKTAFTTISITTSRPTAGAADPSRCCRARSGASTVWPARTT